MEKDTPVLLNENCIKCGHCEAVCPHNALHNDLLGHENIYEINNNPVLDPETAEIFLRSRRSIRCFKKQDVSKEETEKLIDIGRYAQTGSNSQGVSYIVISSKTMESVKKLTMDFYENSTDPMVKMLYSRFAASDKDIIFRGAPMCILALTDKNNPYTANNAKYSLTYIELFAASLKLGTCWAGFFERFTASDSPALRTLLNIQDGLIISGALLFGYPKYEYHRLTHRNPLKLEWR
jgi:nitroreductase